MNDEVVGKEHKKDVMVEMPYDSISHQGVRNKYFNRIIAKVEEKADKIKEGKYDVTYPIILAVYLNDYYTMHINSSDWSYFEDLNNSHFSKRNEFKTVFFYK
jgi:hypothetical protein